MILLVVAVLAVAGAVGSLRWLRVAQREHYLAGSATRFALRWWRLHSMNVTLLLMGVGAILGMALDPLSGLVAAAVAFLGPLGLGLRGRTSPLAWTGRMRRLAATTWALVLVAALAGWLTHPAVTAAAVLGVHLLVDAALALLAPVERRLGKPWVDRAADALRRSGATVVAVTGSYGKTSTKGHIAHLLGETRRVLASPASFNNRMGLARAINEHLAGGIDTFVAEMGTYGPGEIAELCSWIPPDVAVITAIGPVHLERFGSEERIVEAKSEILERASVAVLNVDDPRLRRVADRERERRRVLAVGSRDADVVVDGETVTVDGRLVGRVPASAHPTNVGCAVAVALALEVPEEVIGARLAGITEPEHRLTVSRSPSDVLIIDDTFNSNPAGAEAALQALGKIGEGGRRVVITPGMVELGSRQHEENVRFAARAEEVADRVLVVGRTNRPALVEGAPGAIPVATREEAVEWVRRHLGSGDVVLYENDLPDHYP
ncbi:MAG: Mur ligase family protein [Actinomycetota bacterium]